VDEQEWWLANDLYEQRAYAGMTKFKWIMTEDRMITDPAAYLDIVKAQL